MFTMKWQQLLRLTARIFGCLEDFDANRGDSLGSSLFLIPMFNLWVDMDDGSRITARRGSCTPQPRTII